MGDRNLVELRGVTRHYGAVHAVDGIDLDIRAGELFGLIGHNGAGKSTLFKMMLGLVPPTAGTIHIDGIDVSGGGFRDVRRRIGYQPENVVLYDNLTGIETLQFFSKLKGTSATGCGALLDKVGLSHAADRRVSGYSRGMRQRLGFAQALLGNPRLIFLDEPTSGLDPEAVRAFYATLRELRDAGVTIVITSHVLAEIQERVDRLAILTSGKVRALGTIQALREQVSLPLVLRVHVRSEQATETAMALREFGVSADVAADDRLIVKCPRADKMRVLDALAGRRDAILDIEVREPSLEDLFFGFSD